MMRQNIVVIPKSELDRIKKNADILNDSEKRKQEERLKLREQSQARVANWTNTIDGQRTLKQKEREERLRKEEEERRRIDEEEAAFQAEERRKKIERANKLLFQENDRVKRFNSQVLMAEVLRERKQQLDVRGKREEYERMHDQEWMSYQEQQVRRQQEAQAIVVEENKKRAQEIQDHQKKQIYEQLGERRKIVSQQEMERKQLLKKTEAEIHREKERMIERRKKDIEYSKGHLVHQQQVREREEEARMKEHEEENKNREFINLKETLNEEHSRREKQRFEEKLRVKQRLIDRQSKMIKDNRQEEEDRLRKHQELMDQKEREREENETIQRKKTIEAIKNSRARQLQHKDTVKALEAREKEFFNHQWRDRNEMLALEDAIERQNQVLKAVSIQDTQKQQMKEKRKIEKAEKRRTMREGKLMQKAMAQEERQFKKYVEDVVKEYEDVQEPIISFLKKNQKTRL